MQVIIAIIRMDSGDFVRSGEDFNFDKMGVFGETDNCCLPGCVVDRLRFILF